MTEPVAPPADATVPSFRGSKFALGLLFGLLGHAIVFGGGFVAARTSSGTSGWDDLAAVATVLVVGGVTVFLVSVVAGVVLVARRRRELGFGLMLGWLVGAVAFWLFLQAQ